MRMVKITSRLLIAGLASGLLAQQPARPPAPLPGQTPVTQPAPAPAPAATPPAQAPAPAATPPAQAPAPAAAPPAQAPAAAPAQAPAAAPPPQAAPAPAPQATPVTMGSMQNASLTEVIDILARQLKINYIIDKGVTGSVTINTYGETKNLDIRSLLDLILRINGAAMVQEGDIYRIVPINAIQGLPLKPEVNAKDIPEDDRPMLNLIFLKYAAVADMAALLKPFLSEGATITAYAPANLLFVLDSRRSMHRLMELTSIFDSNEFAAQRVRLFEVKDARPSDLAKELDAIIKSISLAEKNAPVKFLPIDRINTIVAVAPSPGVFDEIAKWIKKLDVPVKITAGSIDNYVYRVKYGRAELIAGAIMQLYGGYGGGGFGGGGGGYNPFPGAGLPGGPYGTGAGSYGGGGLGGVGGAVSTAAAVA